MDSGCLEASSQHPRRGLHFANDQGRGKSLVCGCFRELSHGPAFLMRTPRVGPRAWTPQGWREQHSSSQKHPMSFQDTSVPASAPGRPGSLGQGKAGRDLKGGKSARGHVPHLQSHLSLMPGSMWDTVKTHRFSHTDAHSWT